LSDIKLYILQPTPTRRPIAASAQAQLAPSTQPQLIQPASQYFQQQPQQIQQYSPNQIQQSSPQQFLVETSRPIAPSPPAPSVRLSDAYRQEQSDPQTDELYASLFSTAGRGLFSPALTPEKAPKLRNSARLTPAPTAQSGLPTVRIPAASRALSAAEYDALVNAGFSITPVG